MARRDSLAAFLQSAQGKSKAKATTPEHELAQKESNYNKASANERLLEKSQDIEDRRELAEATPSRLGRLVPALSQAKETTKQSLDGLRALRIAVHGDVAGGDKKSPRPNGMEQDTDMFKHKIRLLNASAKRARVLATFRSEPPSLRKNGRFGTDFSLSFFFFFFFFFLRASARARGVSRAAAEAKGLGV